MKRDDDLPMMETVALRITARLERAIQRLGLEAPGEFVAIINAIEMQLESGRPVVATVAHLTDALRDLTLARGVWFAGRGFAGGRQLLLSERNAS